MEVWWGSGWVVEDLGGSGGLRVGYEGLVGLWLGCGGLGGLRVGCEGLVGFWVGFGGLGGLRVGSGWAMKV